jgi:hypothetical protein
VIIGCIYTTVLTPEYITVLLARNYGLVFPVVKGRLSVDGLSVLSYECFEHIGLVVRIVLKFPTLFDQRLVAE